jgi:hypothetical protein
VQGARGGRLVPGGGFGGFQRRIRSNFPPIHAASPNATDRPRHHASQPYTVVRDEPLCSLGCMELSHDWGAPSCNRGNGGGEGGKAEGSLAGVASNGRARAGLSPATGKPGDCNTAAKGDPIRKRYHVPQLPPDPMQSFEVVVVMVVVVGCGSTALPADAHWPTRTRFQLRDRLSAPANQRRRRSDQLKSRSTTTRLRASGRSITSKRV